MLHESTIQTHLVGALGLMALAISGCGGPANGTASNPPAVGVGNAQVTFHVDEMGQRLNLL